MAPDGDDASPPDDSIEGLDLDLYADVDRLTEEFRDQLDRPGAVDAQEFASRHPELAAVLLPALRAVETLQRGRATSGPVGTLRHGDSVGRFTVVGELGRGGMGVVYEAAEEGLERTVALKVLDGELANDAFKQRFQREARAAARLEHPAIVPVYGTGEQGALLWYAMRRIEGAALDVLLRRMGDEAAPEHRESAERALLSGFVDSGSDASSATSGTGVGAVGAPRHIAIARLGQRLANALAYAHSEGVLHRDIKPGNVLVDASGHAHLTDFGLCKLEGEATLTEASDVIGTLRYMPPEGLHRDVDARGDVYGLGLVLYELLTRRPAFDRRERARLVTDIERRDPVAPRKVDPTIPRDLERIVLKAIAKLPEERYATAEAFAQDLGAFLAGKPIQARALGLWYLLRLAARRNRAAAIVAAVGTAALLALGITYVVQLQGLLRDVDEARQEAEHGEAVALLESASDGMLERPRRATRALLERVNPSERNWVWHHLSERANPVPGEKWTSIRKAVRVESFDDGAVLAWEPREVQIFDPSTLRRLASITPAQTNNHAHLFFGAAPTGDGRTVLVADGKTRSILSWSGDRRDLPETFLPLPGSPRLLRVHPLAGVGAALVGDTIHRFDSATGEVLGVHTPRDQREVRQVELLSDGSVVYGTTRGEVWHVRDAGSEPRRIARHERDVTAVLVRDDRVLASGDSGGALVFQPSPGRVDRRTTVPLGSEIWWLGDGGESTVHAGLRGGTLVRIDLKTRALVRNWPIFSTPPVATIERTGADGTPVLSAVALNGRVRDLDETYRGGPFVGAMAAGPLAGVAFSPDGDRIAFTAQDGHLHIAGETSVVLPAENRFTRPDFHASGHFVAAGGLVVDARSGEELLRWWPKEGSVLACKWWGDELDLLAFDDASERIGEIQDIHVWTWNRTQPDRPPVHRGSFPGDVEWVSRPEFAFPEGERAVVVSGALGTLFRCDLDPVERTWTAQPHEYPVVAMAIDPRSGHIVTAGREGSIRTSDLATGSAIARVETELDAHSKGSNTIKKLSFHPVEDLLATVDAAGFLRVWTYPEGRPVFSFQRLLDVPLVPRFSPGGRWLTYGTSSGAVELIGHGEPPLWARTGSGRRAADAMVDRALAAARSEPLLEHEVVAAGAVLAVLGGIEPRQGGEDERLAEIRALLAPYVDAEDLRMFYDPSFDDGEAEVGRFGFRTLDAFRER